MVELTKAFVPNKSKYDLLKTQVKYSKREGHCACSKDNLVYVFGGVLENTDAVTESNELNLYDAESEVWSAPTTFGDLPSSKSAASLVCINNFLYLFGGLNAETGWSNDLHKFNIASGEWTLVKHDFSPVARDKHCAVSHNNDMYVFGGFGPAVEKSTSVLNSDSSDFTWFNDVFKYDTVRDIWIQLADNNTRPAPTPRAAASMSAMGHSATSQHPVLYVFGGRDTTRRQGDFFAFDTEIKTWTMLTPKENPMARSFHETVCLDYKLGYMVLIGGRSNRDKHFAETHVYSRDTNTWTKVKSVDGVDGRGQMTACLVVGGAEPTSPSHAAFNVIMIGGSAGFDAAMRAAQIVYDSVYRITFTRYSVGPGGDEITNIVKTVDDEEKPKDNDEVPEKKPKLDDE